MSLADSRYPVKKPVGPATLRDGLVDELRLTGDMLQRAARDLQRDMEDVAAGCLVRLASERLDLLRAALVLHAGGNEVLVGDLLRALGSRMRSRPGTRGPRGVS